MRKKLTSLLWRLVPCVPSRLLPVIGVFILKLTGMPKGFVRIVLAGPPHSGKSVLRESVKQAILELVRKLGIPVYPYIITAQPDGEWAGFQFSVGVSADRAMQDRTAYKGKFTPHQVSRWATAVASCTEPLTLVDIGGIPSAENKAICSAATHAILLAGDMSRLPEWRSFCAELGLRIVAEIHSDYTGTDDRVEGVGPDDILRGSVHHLERGEIAKDRPMVQALARHLVKLALSGE